MTKLLIFVGIVLVFVLPSTRCIIFNLHYLCFYTVYDLIMYFVKRKWRDVNVGFGITCFIGMFGHGKTLSMTHHVRQLYKKYGDKILIISNYKLVGIPYVELVNFNQLLRLADDHQGYDGYVVCIDEIEAVLSNRSYSSFPLALLSPLCQQRKLHIKMFVSAQRWAMIDIIFRRITNHVVDCNKFWRLQSMRYYDAWDYENAPNTQLIKPFGARWWFVRNIDYNSYDTSEQIREDAAANFISNDETLSRIGLDTVCNEDLVKRRSKRLKRKVKR